MRQRLRGALFVPLSVLLLCVSFAAAQTKSAETQVHGVTKLTAALLEAFNKQDANALAALWKADAIHVDNSTGKQTQGRDAITKAYQQLFKNDPKCRMAIHVTAVREVAPTVFSLDAVCDLQHTNGAATRSDLNLVAAQQDGNWLIDQVHETEVPILPPAAAGLSELDWLIGHWQDKTDKGIVENDIRWSGKLTYIVRNYWHAENGAAVRDGTQLIGWDAEQKCIRSWLFDDTGSFGEGTWQRDGENKWVNKLMMKLPNGKRASFTQVIERVSPDKFTVQLIDREVDGATQPNSAAVTLTRVQSGTTPTGEKAE